MPHDHAGAADRAASRSRLAWTLALVLAYMVAEIVGGIVTNSLALLADAGHMLSDAASLGLALFATWIAERPPTRHRTYGYLRAEILAALANGVALVLVAVFVFREAWARFLDPPEVAGGLMMGIAAGGLLVNLAALRILHPWREASLNLRGAWLHVLADAAGSVGALVAGGLIWWRGWSLADPVASALIGVLVLASSWRILRDSTRVLMESAPPELDVHALERGIRDVEGVREVHDLHAWTITSGLTALSAHVVSSGARADQEILDDVRRLVAEHGIEHCTIQVEPEGLEEPDTQV